MTISSSSRPKKPELSQHIQACKDLSQIGDLLEKEVLVRIESAACDRIYVRGYSGSVSAEELSQKTEQLAQKSQVLSIRIEQIEDPYLLAGFMMIEMPHSQRDRVADLLLQTVFSQIKKNFYSLNKDDRRFYVSMNLFNRAVLFPYAAYEGFGVFAHAQPLLKLGKSADELKEIFSKKNPLMIEVKPRCSVTTSILFPSSKDGDSESEK